MRNVIVGLAAVIGLMGCGEDRSTAPELAAPAALPVVPKPTGPPLPSWRAALTDNPVLIKNYSTSLGPLAGNTVESTNSETRVTTSSVNGAWAAMLILGPDAKVTGAVLKVELQAERGAVHVLSTIDGAPSGYVAKQETVAADGQREVWLPIDTAGAPLLVIANGNTEGNSVAVIRKIEVLAPPGSAPVAMPAEAIQPASAPPPQ